MIVGADTRTSISGYVSNRLARKISFVLDAETDEWIRDGTVDPFHGPFLPSTDTTDDDDADHSRGGDRGDGSDVGDGGTKGSRPRRTRSSSSSSSSLSTCCVCRSWSAADTQLLVEVLRHELYRRRLVGGGRFSSPRCNTVSVAAHILRDLAYDGGDRLLANLICTGYNHIARQGVIYAIRPGGSMWEEPSWATGGSGAPHLVAHVDATLGSGRSRNDHKDDGVMTTTDDDDDERLLREEDAIDFVTGAIRLAVGRDGSSGGFIRIYAIDRNGKREILRMNNNHNNNAPMDPDREKRPSQPRELPQFAPHLRKMFTSIRES